MKRKGYIFLIIFIAFVVLLVFLIIRSSSTPGQYDEFAKCLTGKGAKMYGTDWCKFCQEQKSRFGKSFKFVDYINCDKNKAECNSAGITGYPTWIINGESYTGVQPLEHLSTLTKCEL